MEFYTPVLFISMTPKLALEEGLRYDTSAWSRRAQGLQLWLNLKKSDKCHRPASVFHSLSNIRSCSPAERKMTEATSSTQMDHVRKEKNKTKHAAFKGNELLRAIKDHFSPYYSERVSSAWAQELIAQWRITTESLQLLADVWETQAKMFITTRLIGMSGG